MNGIYDTGFASEIQPTAALAMQNRWETERFPGEVKDPQQLWRSAYQYFSVQSCDLSAIRQI